MRFHQPTPCLFGLRRNAKPSRQVFGFMGKISTASRTRKLGRDLSESWFSFTIFGKRQRDMTCLPIHLELKRRNILYIPVQQIIWRGLWMNRMLLEIDPSVRTTIHLFMVTQREKSQSRIYSLMDPTRNLVRLLIKMVQHYRRQQLCSEQVYKKLSCQWDFSEWKGLSLANLGWDQVSIINQTLIQPRINWPIKKLQERLKREGKKKLIATLDTYTSFHT